MKKATTSGQSHRRTNADTHAPARRRRKPSSAVERALEILQEEARKNPESLDADEKQKIANIAAQRLHIYRADQMDKFCNAYWRLIEAVAVVADITRVAPREKPAKRVRLGATTRILGAAESLK